MINNCGFEYDHILLGNNNLKYKRYIVNELSARFHKHDTEEIPLIKCSVGMCYPVCKTNTHTVCRMRVNQEEKLKI